MGRKLMRVPLNFDWPISEIWKGYDSTQCDDIPIKTCSECPLDKEGCSEDDPRCIYYPANQEKWRYEPPTGEGYQLWETTTEGSPVSPVFEKIEDLCEWCAENATTFANFKASADEWRSMLDEDFVRHTEGNFIFI